MNWRTGRVYKTCLRRNHRLSIPVAPPVRHRASKSFNSPCSSVLCHRLASFQVILLALIVPVHAIFSNRPHSNYVSVPANNNLKSRLLRENTANVWKLGTKPRLQVIVCGNWSVIWKWFIDFPEGFQNNRSGRATRHVEASGTVTS